MRLLAQILIAYFAAFLIVSPPLVRLAAAGEDWGDLAGQSIYERKGNRDLIFSITSGQTKLGKNVTGDYTTQFIQLDSTPKIIAKYSPLLAQGQIAMAWIHNFLTPQGYNGWVEKMKKEGLYYGTSSNWEWYSVPVKDPDGVWRYKAAVFRVFTPADLLEPTPLANGENPNQDILDMLNDNGTFDPNRIISCSANNFSTEYCSDRTFKAGFEGFLQIVSAVARKYNATQGVLVVENVSVHKEVDKSSGFFKSKVTVKLFMDSSPSYYMIVPPNTPGTESPVTGFNVGGMGYLKVDQATAVGWDWTSKSVKFYEKSKSGWNGITGFLLGIGTLILGVVLPGSGFFTGWSLSNILVGIGGTYAAFSTVEIAVHGNFGTFHGAFKYAKLGVDKGVDDSDVKHKLLVANWVYWTGVPLGKEYDGAAKTLQDIISLKSYKEAGWFNGMQLDQSQREMIEHESGKKEPGMGH